MHTALQPTLENELVLLRPLNPNDFDDLYLVAKDPLIWQQHQNNDRWKLQVFKEFFKAALNSKGAFAIIEKTSQRIIGSSRFQLREKSPRAVEIGWTFLSRNYWGGIYNASFKKLMVNHAFRTFDFVIFHVNGNNFRSQKAVRKLGGILIDPTLGDFQFLRNEQPGTLTFLIQKNEES